MVAPFQHQQLDRSRQEIRLLELLPRSQWRNDCLPTCSIFHADLDQCPHYLALSYVWGDKSDQREILINGHPFDVTKNLLEALIGIVGPKRIVIWIDAICINQADEEEKGWQVALMGDIYRKTSEVLAWLGPSADNSDTVLDRLNALGSIAEVCGLHVNFLPCISIWQAMMRITLPIDHLASHWVGRNLLPTYILMLGILLHAIGGFASHDHLLRIDDLDRLFRRPWWTRIWVLQEISLPAQASFVCGTKRISRQRFRAAYEAYRAFVEALAPQSRQNQPLSTYAQEILALDADRVQTMMSGGNTYQTKDCSLVQILRATSFDTPYDVNDRQCLDSTDPRDKIFALLGITSDKEELKAWSVFPDYTKSKEEVYTTAMVAMLRQGHTSLLSQGCGIHRPDRLPSWVPNWSKPSLELLQEFGRDHIGLNPRFNACGSKKACQVNFNDSDHHGQTITIMGSICDKVLRTKHVRRVCSRSRSAYPLEWLHAVLELSCLANATYSDLEAHLQIVARASHAGMQYDMNGWLERAHKFPATVNVLRSFDPGNILGLQRTHQEDALASSANYGIAEWNEVQVELVRISKGRLPFVTSKGRLGIGSTDIKENDVVALISGAQTPLILRRVGGRFMVVGEAYVDGIMDGEAAEDGVWDYIELE